MTRYQSHWRFTAYRNAWSTADSFRPANGRSKRITRSFPFDDRDEMRLVRADGEPSQGRVGVLAVDLDEGFPLERIGRLAAGRPREAEQIFETGR